MSDYNFLMESRLSPEQFNVLTLISRVAAEQGVNLYLVGGAVRDLTYGLQAVRDLDFAVEGSPQKILRRLSAAPPAPPSLARSRAFSSEPAPLTLAYQHFDARRESADLHFSNGVRAELAMCRQEVYPKPGRHPEIQPTMIFDDLKRRDFSVNAMAVSLHPNSRGLLLDPTNGAADIERRELRVLHSRSFLEDSSRIFRLLRLGMRLGFKPEERTKNLLESALENRLVDDTDADQQGRELRAILQEENPARVLKMLGERKLLAGLDRKLASARLPYDGFSRVRSVAQNIPGADPYLLHFHCLVEKLGSRQKSRLAKKIIGDGKAIKLVLNLEREAKKLAKVLASSKANLPSQVYALLCKQPLPLLLFLLAHSPRAKVHNRLKKYFVKYSQVRARLPRAELQALGVKPGREFDRIIEHIFFDQLDGKIKTHQQLLKQLRALAGVKEPPPKPVAPPSAKRHGAKSPTPAQPPPKPVAPPPAKRHGAKSPTPAPPPPPKAPQPAAKAPVAAPHKKKKKH